MTRFLLAILMGLIFAAVGWADEPAEQAKNWGTLRGRFLYQGKPPAREPLRLTRRIPGMVEPMFDESLIVNEENKGLANVILWLDHARSEPLPPIHPSYQEKADDVVELEAIGGRYRVRVGVLRTGQDVRLVNSDPVAHNFKIDAMLNPPYNVLTAPMSRVPTSISFETPERIPVPVSSSIYPWIRGWLLVQDHPYVAVSDADGRFEIKNLPVGDWKFRVWHERAGYLREVVRGMTKEEWKRGLLQTTINPGDNNLREIYVSGKVFTQEDVP